MQRITSLVRTVSAMINPLAEINNNFISHANSLLKPSTVLLNQVLGFKVKGRVKRRCSACYLVVRDQRLYNICAKHPRHKAMAMKPKPHNTWLLTHASQSPIRPW